MLYVCLQCLRESGAWVKLERHKGRMGKKMEDGHRDVCSYEPMLICDRRLLQSKDDLPTQLSKLPTKDEVRDSHLPP